MVNPVGYRFSPTDEELIDHYLRPKTLGSHTSDVDQVISTVDITSFDPCHLPSQSMIKSRDLVWYFFGRKKNIYNRGNQQKRKTISGSWSKTGKTMNIMRKRGNHEKIGEKRVLVFKRFDKSKTKWVMHEYHATFLSSNQMMTTYTICKIMFNGEEKDISSSLGSEVVQAHMNNDVGSSSGVEVSSSFTLLTSQESESPHEFSGILNVEQETQLEDEMGRTFDNLTNDDWKRLFDDVNNEQMDIVSMQEDRSDYRPQKSLVGVCVGHSSDDSDSDSISVITTTTTNLQNSIETLSTRNSFSSSSNLHRVDQIKDLQVSPNSTIKLVSLAQEVSQNLSEESEIGEYILDQKTIKKKKVDFFYRIIQRFAKKLHLCSSISRTCYQ